MAFFKSIKRAFGFDSERDFEVDGIDATVRPLSQRQEEESEAVERAPQPRPRPMERKSDTQRNVEYDEELQLKIFDSVVKVFNESLPSFLRESVNPDAQKKYLLESLDTSVREYLNCLEDSTKRRVRGQLERDRQRYEGELRELRQKLKTLEDSGEDQRQKQLSTERQRRALNERVRDLEGKVTTLLAEKEQYELENKSLLNKLRISSVNGEISDEEERLTQQVDNLKAKNEIADKMVSEFKSSAANALAEVESLKSQLADARQQLADAQAENKEMLEGLKQVEEIGAQLDRFEQLKASKDKRIRELVTENNRLNNLLKSRELLEAKERKEAQEPKSEITFANDKPAAPKAPARKSKKSKPVITAIDESLDDTDWLVSTPPPGLTINKEAADDFGYIEPEHKPAPDSDAQMSLF